MNLGSVLSQLRKKNGQSQRELANSIGVSNGAVAMWETDKRQPDLEMLKKIANYYNVSIDYLLGNDPPFSAHTLPLNLNLEDAELLGYYHKLSLIDKRWIMGQMIDLIKKAEEQNDFSLKEQRS